MKKTLLALLYLTIGIGPVANADGLIIVHDPGPTPPVFPPPWPGPRPPRPPFVPPPRPYTFAPLEVKYHHVDVKIRDQVATTTVDQEFYNPNDRQLEGTYVFPVPQGAHIDKFSLEVDGRQLEAELLAADKARQIYEDIVRRHRDPALLEYAGRDLFKVRIFPIEPRRGKRVRLTYTELLKTDSGVTRYLYPLNTEKYSAKPVPNVSIKLELQSSRPLKTVYSPSHNVEVRRHGDDRATIGFEAKDVKPDTDFVLLFSKAEGDVGLTLLTHRTGTDDGYFLVLATPSFSTDTKNVVAKDITFVLDTSGSMAGKKLDQAKKALTYCVESLNEHDRFEIIRFSTEAEPLFGRLVDAARVNRDRAELFVRELKASGGTAIHDALKQAIAVRPDDSKRPCYVVFLTDGLPTVGETDNDRIIAMVRSSAGPSSTTRVFCFGIGTDVNTHLLDRITETTRAASAYVFPDEDIEVKVSSFFNKINEPVLTNVKLHFPDTVRVTMLHPPTMPDLFKGEQLVLVGRYSGNGTGNVTLEGAANGNPKSLQYQVQFPESAADMDFIPRLWATRRIGYLLDEIRLRGENPELRDEVVQLARKHGVVTPYTAYLIHEDEQRRNVPMAMRSFPQLATNQQVSAVAQEVYQDYLSEATGGSALAAASYVSSQKVASQVDHALQAGAAEVSRALMYRWAATSPNARGRAQSASGTGGAEQLLASTQQTRFVGGRTFFFNGDQWIDSQVQYTNPNKKIRVQFGSREYFDLLARNPEVAPWFALGRKVQFVLGPVLYEVTE
ncbi:MAG: VIT domain-containing protein [Verrucomicrobiia bacterium]